MPRFVIRVVQNFTLPPSLFSAVIWLFSRQLCNIVLLFSIYQCLADDILCPVQMLVAIISLDLHLHNLILCALSCLPVCCLIFFSLFSTRGISCILVQLNRWVLKTWFGKWFVTAFFSYVSVYNTLFNSKFSHKEHNVRLARWVFSSVLVFCSFGKWKGIIL